MTNHYPIVLEHEPNGTVSAYVVGLPGVFAAADSERTAAAAIRSALRAHFAALETLHAKRRSSRASLRVAKVTYRK
jgi:predicted RNase H-like HicB family nuclease